MRKNSKNIEKDKIIEIIKIKLILEKIINKKGEKMSKKKIIKEQKKKEEIIDKNKIENSEIQEDKKITIQTINGNKLNRYEKMKKFRNLENINITYGDKEKGKFKNFQELYTLITNTIEKKNKEYIYSDKDDMFYILCDNFITSKRIETKNNINSIYRALEKESNKLKKKDINFNYPSEDEKNTLKNMKLLGNGNWSYKVYNENEKEEGYFYETINSSFNYENSYEFNVRGSFYLYDFFDDLNERNAKSGLKNKLLKDFEELIKKNNIDTYKNYTFSELQELINFINDTNIKEFFELEYDESDDDINEFFKEYRDSLLENKKLMNFEVMLNYELFDSSIIDVECEDRFNKLSEAYNMYKNFISCIYNKDDEKVGIFFDTEKIIKSIKNGEKLFNNIEITYSENQLGIEKEIVYSDKSVYYYKNGEIEEIYSINSGKNRSIYCFTNKDVEERNYEDGILNGKSLLNFFDGATEKRYYKDGILDGKAIYKNKNKEKEYFYNNGIREEMPKLKYYLSIDKERINIDDYQEAILLDPNVGHWDLKKEDTKELKEILGKNVYKRDPRKDVNQGGIVAIDFGTKSTVVVYQKDSENILPMRISGEKLDREVRDTDYENPTVIEFRDINKFLTDYKAKIGRPDTKWEDVTVSHTAFKNLIEGASEQFDSIIADIKQWTASKNKKIVVIDKKEKEILLPPYLELDEKSKDYLDPVELYAYYIGSYINNMVNGLYLEYYLSFPVTYEKAIRQKILKSFERGIQKSLPAEIQEDKDLMRKFRVRHGANEPAAFAVCALSQLEIEPKNEEDEVYYGVFDFGGGTTDFDFGIWKYSEDEDMYDYELEHFGAGGERYLGGENIIKELAYRVFSNNSVKLRREKIQYIRPEWCEGVVGEETLISQTKQARLNTRKLAEELRKIWENNNDERRDIIKINLFNSYGEVKNGFELEVVEKELKDIIKEKIEKGIKNFFIKMEDAFKGENVKEINIFLAGNSCKHPFVEEIFKRYVDEKKDKLKINLFDTKALEEVKKLNKANPTAKTGVAFGLIYSRNSGRIKVISRDEKANLDNEINFKFYVGNNRRSKFNCIMSPNSNYEEFKFFGIVKSDIFELYYSTSPEAQTNEMKSSEAQIKRINLKKDYEEESRYRIYLKVVTSDKLVYAIVKEEKDIETKKFVEEGEINLN